MPWPHRPKTYGTLCWTRKSAMYTAPFVGARAPSGGSLMLVLLRNPILSPEAARVSLWHRAGCHPSPSTGSRPLPLAELARCRNPSPRNLGFDELRKKGERFLPAEIASLRWDGLGYPFLDYVYLSTAGDLIQGYRRLHFSG